MTENKKLIEQPLIPAPVSICSSHIFTFLDASPWFSPFILRWIKGNAEGNAAFFWQPWLLQTPSSRLGCPSACQPFDEAIHHQTKKLMDCWRSVSLVVHYWASFNHKIENIVCLVKGWSQAVPSLAQKFKMIIWPWDPRTLPLVIHI